MLHCIRLASISLTLILLAACATAPTKSAATATTAPAAELHCQCLVCKHNADLACVDVIVEPDTPRTVYKGTTYYFCSDSCKTRFEKNPDKYTAEASVPRP